MFKDLLNFGVTKNWKQAIAFYVFFFVLYALAGSVYGMLFFHGETLREVAEVARHDRVLPLLMVTVTAVIGGALLWKKKLHTHPAYILLVVISLLLVIFGGALLAMLPLAFITTREAKTVG